LPSTRRVTACSSVTDGAVSGDSGALGGDALDTVVIRGILSSILDAVRADTSMRWVAQLCTARGTATQLVES